MQVISLKGVSYTSTKRTTQRNHAADIDARSHHDTKQDRRIGSLQRLRSAKKLHVATADYTLNSGIKERLTAKGMRIGKMIEQAEKALQRG